MTEITQADRLAAASFLSARALGTRKSEYVALFEAQEAEEDHVHPLVFLFAQHRTQARTSALEEAERACLAAQYSPHPYTDIKHAIRNLITKGEAR